MKALVLAVSAAALTAALPSIMQRVMVIGGSYRQGCFKAAEAAQHDPGNAQHLRQRIHRKNRFRRRIEMATHVNRGILLMLRDDYDRAYSDFSTAMAMDPNRSEP